MRASKQTPWTDVPHIPGYEWRLNENGTRETRPIDGAQCALMTLQQGHTRFHRERMEALLLPEHTTYNRDELIRLYNRNVVRAYDYGIEAISTLPSTESKGT